MNSWVMFDLGAQVEEVFGQARLIVIYFCCDGRADSWPARSGAARFPWARRPRIMGLIGAMIALGMMHRSAVADAIKRVYVRYAIYMVIFGLLRSEYR